MVRKANTVVSRGEQVIQDGPSSRTQATSQGNGPEVDTCGHRCGTDAACGSAPTSKEVNCGNKEATRDPKEAQSLP
jgi:hypothetical protein